MEEALPQQNNNSPPLQYQQCQHCSRTFFKGKLKYHLKLCTPDNPMIISPKKSTKETIRKPTSQQKSLIFSKQQKICDRCHTKLPSFLYEKHAEHCLNKEKDADFIEAPQQINKKSSTQINFKEKEYILPAIKPSARHVNTKNSIIKQPYQVKLREELSCFRRAQEIKQIQCPTCQRIFSKQASLRHIPICQTLRKNQQLSIALKKRKVSKSMVQQLPSNRNRTKRPINILQKDNPTSSFSMVINPQKQYSF